MRAGLSVEGVADREKRDERRFFDEERARADTATHGRQWGVRGDRESRGETHCTGGYSHALAEQMRGGRERETRERADRGEGRALHGRRGPCETGDSGQGRVRTGRTDAKARGRDLETSVGAVGLLERNTANKRADDGRGAQRHDRRFRKSATPLSGVSTVA